MDKMFSQLHCECTQSEISKVTKWLLVSYGSHDGVTWQIFKAEWKSKSRSFHTLISQFKSDLLVDEEEAQGG